MRCRAARLSTWPSCSQRGNNRQNIFLVDEDRRFYIEALRATCRQDGLTIGHEIGIGCDLERERGLPSTPLILVAGGLL